MIDRLNYVIELRDLVTVLDSTLDLSYEHIEQNRKVQVMSSVNSISVKNKN